MDAHLGLELLRCRMTRTSEGCDGRGLVGTVPLACQSHWWLGRCSQLRWIHVRRWATPVREVRVGRRPGQSCVQ